ncbi:IclR family transcriptional regulator [Streptomyces diacarni]|uniref:IclR family transcriptional regulator n=1 Tax=Streptomyces diacarni TaxID=2800381 RepID=A0A367ENB4_9ACTN|nr:IclR family transcriptional regulator [Streptomyces diacarni]RCG19598.1 IclR family transcriptional regulator [Streptomyces diacarni]
MSVTATEYAVAASTPVSMIDRVVTILDAFESADGLTLAQVVRRTGLPRSSAHRILEHLAEVKYLRRDAHTYRLGMRIMELGALVIHQDRVREAAAPHLHQLHTSTGLVAHLAILDEGAADVVYLDKVGNRFGTLLPSRIGGRLPAARTGVGKALLAHAPRATAAGLPERLHAELAQIRERGVAHDREEAIRGVACVAAPVVGAGESTPALAAVSVCGPAGRVRSASGLPSLVRQAAAHIWRTSAGHPSTHRPC